MTAVPVGCFYCIASRVCTTWSMSWINVWFIRSVSSMCVMVNGRYMRNRENIKRQLFFSLWAVYVFVVGETTRMANGVTVSVSSWQQ